MKECEPERCDQHLSEDKENDGKKRPDDAGTARRLRGGKEHHEAERATDEAGGHKSVGANGALQSRQEEDLQRREEENKNGGERDEPCNRNLKAK